MSRAPSVGELQGRLNQYHAAATAVVNLESVQQANAQLGRPPSLVTVSFEGGNIQVGRQQLLEAVRIGRDALRQELTAMGVGEVAV